MDPIFDVAVIGGGPSGATAAERLARKGHRVLLVDPDNRIKPCGGAIPSRAISDYSIPDHLIVARANSARITAPSGRKVEMHIGDAGHVGMVDRETFDPFLRERAAAAGAHRITGKLETMTENADQALSLVITSTGNETNGEEIRVSARMVIGADGANSAVRRAMFRPGYKPPYVFAYHEIVEAPIKAADRLSNVDCCDVVYDGQISPDFYGWVFPHGSQISVGCGSAVKGHNLRQATALLRKANGLEHARTLRREGAPLPLKPLRRWDNGRNVLLAGDAAGTVAPSSGEGIYYSMLCGQLCADAVDECLATGRVSALKQARRQFMAEHGRVFFILGVMQKVWYRNDRMREKFVAMCADPDVQKLTWESYLNKKLSRRDPLAHLRVFFKDLAQLLSFPVSQR